MSDDQPRSDNGQFAADASDPYGQQALEAENGYTPMVVANPVKEEADDFSGGKRGLRHLFRNRRRGITNHPDRVHDVDDGSKRDANEVVSLEQAAHDLTAWRESQGDGRAASVSKDFANEIDQQRAEAAKEGEDLKSRGVENPEEGNTARR